MSTPVIDRPIYVITKYIYAFFITNLYFFICNILFFAAYFLADFTIQNILLFYVVTIPMGPAITSVLATMAKLVREKEVSPTKEYWIAYKKNFIPTIKFWLIQLTIILILLVDIFYANKHVTILSTVFLILLNVTLFIMIYALPIITRFEVKLKNLFIVSIYANFKYFKTTLLNITTLVAFGVMYYFLPSISSLFLVSLTGFFIMYNLQAPLLHMEKELSH